MRIFVTSCKVNVKMLKKLAAALVEPFWLVQTARSSSVVTNGYFKTLLRVNQFSES